MLGKKKKKKTPPPPPPHTPPPPPPAGFFGRQFFPGFFGGGGGGPVWRNFGRNLLGSKKKKKKRGGGKNPFGGGDNFGNNWPRKNNNLKGGKKGKKKQNVLSILRKKKKKKNLGDERARAVGWGRKFFFFLGEGKSGDVRTQTGPIFIGLGGGKWGAVSFGLAEIPHFPKERGGFSKPHPGRIWPGGFPPKPRGGGGTPGGPCGHIEKNFRLRKKAPGEKGEPKFRFEGKNEFFWGEKGGGPEGGKKKGGGPGTACWGR